MCGIVGAVAQRNVSPILLEGIKRLEYRGYDSAGLALINADKELHRIRAVGKVKALEGLIASEPVDGMVGIAHTRWATHGEPNEINAHPHTSNHSVALVHNGIIENFEELKKEHIAEGFQFTSETDTEVIAHEIYKHLESGLGLLEATQKTVARLEGAFAIAVVSPRAPEELVAARKGSPLVVGYGIGEHFVASDCLALLPVTQQFQYLEEGDVVSIRSDAVSIYDDSGQAVSRPIQELSLSHEAADKGSYRHYMLKEIFEQPEAIRETLEGRLSGHQVLEQSFGVDAGKIFDQVKAVHIIACGTSYHAGYIAKYWFESLAGIACHVEVASEYRYRHTVVAEDTLFVTLSQSGETADTLSALRVAKERGYLASLAICNVPGSTLVRESDLVLMTHAGPEIGVASTKAFTAQLTALLMLVVVAGRRHKLDADKEKAIVHALTGLPKIINHVLELDEAIQATSEQFIDRHHALFLGRGAQYPVAMEGALKLKEISYIHAEAYPAGELKHGPLALVDKTMPVVVIAPKNDLLEKLKSNLQEVRARGGDVIVFAEFSADFEQGGEQMSVLKVPEVPEYIAPIVYTIPLQLLAYYVAVLKGTDIDQPRNLAKSVTVE